MVTTRRHHDGSFNQTSWKAADAAAANPNVEIRNIQSIREHRLRAQHRHVHQQKCGIIVTVASRWVTRRRRPRPSTDQKSRSLTKLLAVISNVNA